MKRNEKGQFEKGIEPWNKGKSYKFENHINKTSYKKGERHPNYKPIGSERIERDDQVVIKVSERKWMPKHRYLWELENGPTPKGHVVIFANGNKRDFSKENLLLVSRAQLMSMNKNNLIKDDRELTKSGLMVADLLLKIGEVEKA